MSDLYAEMIGSPRLGHRQAALIGQLIAVEAEASYIMAGVVERRRMGEGAWPDLYRAGLEVAYDVHEAWRRYTAPVERPPGRGEADPRDPVLTAELETAVARYRALLEKVRAEAGVAGSSWDTT